MTESKIKQQMEQLYQAMISKDIDTLESLLAPDYYLVHMTGYQQTKAEWLAQIVSEEMRYFSQTLDSIDVTVAGDRATIVSRNRVDARIYGSRHTWRLQLVSQLKYQEGQWLFQQTIASTY